jgi:hypothetical protein
VPLINHPDVVNDWIILELGGDKIEKVLMVEVDLYLNTKHPQYHSEKVNALIAAVENLMKSDQTIHRARIIPNRRA